MDRVVQLVSTKKIQTEPANRVILGVSLVQLQVMLELVNLVKKDITIVQLSIA